MIHFLKKILRKLKPSERNRIVSLSPHHILLYKLILSELKKRNNFLFVDERTISYGIPRNNVLINLRHDIDSLPHTITNLTDVEEELGLRSIIYVFTDNKIYNNYIQKNLFLVCIQPHLHGRILLNIFGTSALHLKSVLDLVQNFLLCMGLILLQTTGRQKRDNF